MQKLNSYLSEKRVFQHIQKQNKNLNSRHFESQKKKKPVNNDFNRGNPNLIKSSQFQSQAQHNTKTDIFSKAIRSVTNYYEQIQICVEEYKKQEISVLLKLKEEFEMQVISKRKEQCYHYDRQKKMARNEKLKMTQSVSSTEKNNATICQFVKQFLQNLQQKIKTFSYIGIQWIKLIYTKQECETVRRQRSGKLKWLQKAEQVLDLSLLERREKQGEQINQLNKRPFRELFPDDSSSDSDNEFPLF